MSRRSQMWEDDDGRTIADMSGISGPSLLQPQKADAQKSAQQERKPLLEGKARWMFMLGALKASLLIALAFLGGLGIIIFLLLQIWT